ncbi:hypothetical protein HUE87_08390 [Candidatus Sulfurimonas marisnigri]|uniref:Uncharacterized protein n=1 Tax=Candidatus Sulfurimonas marisnigri TaxID=2740405 RepID=A0A7S7LYR1_9BACT|nr:hypothetical protein [Candidatus Sulfurimonas marisnigri]QOY53912.1 hypothetical protein HUE87_08390 [Candidatus Sulfurimonas marisnigri]
MNRINPIYILVLLVMILVLATLKLNSGKIEFNETQEIYKTTETIATELSALKDVYGEKVKKSLKSILKLPALKSKSISETFKASSVNISSKSIDINSLNLLMSKILNSSYNIDSLQIKKLSDDKASFKMEIKW